jgi:hypothetical protein
MTSQSKSTKHLRKFGLTMAVAFGLFAALFWWRDRSWWVYVGGVAALFGVFGLLAPRLLGPVERGWMKVAELLGAVMTRVVLTVGFLIAVTPVGLFMRMRGKDLLKLKFEPEADTYWEPVEPDGPSTRADKPY